MDAPLNSHAQVHGKRKKGASAALWSTFQPHITYLSVFVQGNVEQAFSAAASLNQNPEKLTQGMRIATMLAKMHADEYTLAATILHSAYQDPQTRGKLKKVIVTGDCITLLESLTQGSSEGKTFQNVCSGMHQDVRPMITLLIERLHLLSHIDRLSQKKQQHIAQETRDIYVQMAKRIGMQDLQHDLESRCLSILQPELFRALSALHMGKGTLAQRVLPQISETLQNEFSTNVFRVYREQEKWSMLQKQYDAGDVPITGVPALTLAIVCSDIDSCYNTLRVLHNAWTEECHSFHDYLNTPDINGYQGLHTTVILENGTRVQCKMRTPEMDDYAHRGIAQLVFADGEVFGVEDYFPWMQRLTALALDHAEQPHAFRSALMRDILSDHILIHSTESQTVHIPQHATALDAAFFCFHERALWAQSILLNGQEVSFSSLPQVGVTISLKFAKKRTVKRNWLYHAHTELALTTIRAALGNSSPSKQAAVGRYLLQEILHERRMGFLEEFHEICFADSLKNIGFSSLDEACIAIACGRTEPEEVYNALFEEREETRKNAHPIAAKLKYAASATFIIGAWCLDPVLAKILLIAPYSVNPLDFTILRFVSFFALCLFTVTAFQRQSPFRYKSLPWRDRFLWGAGLSLVGVGIMTYVSLSSLLPQEYIIFMYACILFTPVLHPLVRIQWRDRSTFIALGIGLLALPLLKILRPSMPWVAFAAGMGALVSFSIFTVCMDEFKRRHAVAARLPMLLFAVSCISLLACLLLLPFSTVLTLSTPMILTLLLYGLIITSLPYLLYYKLLLTEGMTFLAYYYSFGTLLTLFAQFIIFGSLHALSLLPLALVFGSGLLFHNRYFYPTTVFTKSEDLND